MNVQADTNVEGNYYCGECASRERGAKRDRERLRRLLCDVGQLLDGWHNDGTAWSEWDESVRKRVADEMRLVDPILSSGDSHG